jgi:predicted RNA-binding protein with PIN domain
MPLLIDGYNLMYAAGILGSGLGPGTLERRRLALLNFLAESLDPKELPQTTVVFDAREAPWGLKQSVQHRGIAVRFATKYESADALIEELIRAASAPRRLVVVSADHEIQRAARRRRAKAVDSEAWYEELLRRRRERTRAAPELPDQPPAPLLQEDVHYWLRQFGEESRPGEPDEELPGEEADEDNPFPPDYGKDLEEQ